MRPKAGNSVNTKGNGRLGSKWSRGLRSLWQDRRGTVTVYVAIVAPALLGIGALTIDLGRLMTVNTELQSAADAAALAGAAELNRFSGARDKARAAAVSAVTNLQTFATGGADVAIDPANCADPPVAPCIRFLKDLPASDGDPITAPNLAATDAEARFIDVHVAARTVTNVLIKLVGGPAISSTSATAVAGNDPVICNVPPMFMCNPTEDPDNTDLEDSVDYAALGGRQMELFHQGGGQGGGGFLTPGNFGLLCPLGTENDPNCGASSVKDALASTAGTCIGLQSVTTKTGVNLQMVRTGVNARFDYWTSQAKDNGNNPWRQQDKFMPAANVTQGGEPPNNAGGNAARCEYSDLPATQAMGLPRDKCHLAVAVEDKCDVVTGNINGNKHIGDGNWKYQEYFRINHRCNLSAKDAFGFPKVNPCKPADWDAVTGAADWPPTRYEIYRYELEREPEAIVMPAQTIYDSAGNPNGTTAENGHAQCFQGTPPEIPGYSYYPDKVRDLTLLGDRRVLTVAVANCYALEANGNRTNGKFSFKPAELVYVFLTELVENPPNSEIYAEILGPLDEGAQDALTRDVIQLYRR